jgi:putative membrane protein
MEEDMLYRRTLLVTLAASAGIPAFAQSQSSNTPRSSDRTASYIEQTMAIGALSLLTSRIATQRAQFAKLKEFSQFEVAEQETVADVMKTLQNDSRPNGKVAPVSDSEAEQRLDAAEREALQNLRAEQAGSSFDRLYSQGQTEGHLKLLHLQESYLDSGRNRDTLAVARLARALIKEHVQLLADLSAEMGKTPTAPR